MSSLRSPAWRGAACAVVARIAQGAGLNASTADTLRRTFAGTLARGGTDLVVLADLLGKARLVTTCYYEPAAAAHLEALHLLPVDH